MKELSKKIKSKIEKAIKGEIKKFIFKKDLEETKLRKRLQSLDVPVLKTHPAELDSTYTNEAYGNQERIKTLNHAIERCYDALHRLEKGNYGVCAECGGSIALGRLHKVPFTRHCIECKTEMEEAIKQRARPGVSRQTFIV